jgi:hypothetical protein
VLSRKDGSSSGGAPDASRCGSGPTMAGRCESRGGGRYGWSAMAPLCGRGLSTGPRSLPAPTATPRA